MPKNDDEKYPTIEWHSAPGEWTAEYLGNFLRVRKKKRPSERMFLLEARNHMGIYYGGDESAATSLAKAKRDLVQAAIHNYLKRGASWPPHAVTAGAYRERTAVASLLKAQAKKLRAKGNLEEALRLLELANQVAAGDYRSARHGDKK